MVLSCRQRAHEYTERRKKTVIKKLCRSCSKHRKNKQGRVQSSQRGPVSPTIGVGGVFETAVFAWSLDDRTLQVPSWKLSASRSADDVRKKRVFSLLSSSMIACFGGTEQEKSEQCVHGDAHSEAFSRRPATAPRVSRSRLVANKSANPDTLGRLVDTKSKHAPSSNHNP